MDVQAVDASKLKKASLRLGKPNRKVGRPSKNLVIQRRYLRRKQFIAKYGCDLIGIMLKKGYIMTKQDAKNAARKEAAKIKADPQAEPAVVDETKVAKDAFAGKDTDLVLKGVVNNLLAGKQVPGFALVPTEKAKINPTVEQIVVEHFAPGHPAYKMSLVTIKNEYAS